MKQVIIKTMKKTAMIEFWQNDQHKETLSTQFNNWCEENWGDYSKDHFRVVQVVMLPEKDVFEKGLIVVFEFEHPEKLRYDNLVTEDTK
jgi:hypothetical protein